MSNFLKNALKALFTKSSTIASTDKIPFNDSEGNVKGQVSISDLQQVLGVIEKRGDLAANQDVLNNSTTPEGLWRSTSWQAATNLPSGAYTSGLLIKLSTSFWIIIYIPVNEASVYICTNWSGTYGAWCKYSGSALNT